jgi:hypothetical protein
MWPQLARKRERGDGKILTASAFCHRGSVEHLYKIAVDGRRAQLSRFRRTLVTHPRVLRD